MKTFSICAAVLAMILTMCIGTVMAEGIAGKVGLTARLGFVAPADSEWLPASGIRDSKIETDSSFAYGGGLIVGIDPKLAFEVDVTHFESDGHTSGFKVISAGVTDVGFGLQYRFLSNGNFSPYLGAGFDVLVNKLVLAGVLAGAGDPHVDNSIGGHIKGGMDCFVTPRIALTAEWRVLIAAKADVTDFGIGVAKFDPTNFSGLVGVRLYSH